MIIQLAGTRSKRNPVRCIAASVVLYELPGILAVVLRGSSGRYTVYVGLDCEQPCDLLGIGDKDR